MQRALPSLGGGGRKQMASRPLHPSRVGVSLLGPPFWLALKQKPT